MTDFYCEQVLTGKFEVEVVFETDWVLAFNHTQPYFEAHLVIIPKQHIDSVACEEATHPQLASDTIHAIQQITAKLDQQYGGCKVCTGTGYQQKTTHLHWYIFAGKRLRNDDGSVFTSC